MKYVLKYYFFIIYNIQPHHKFNIWNKATKSSWQQSRRRDKLFGNFVENQAEMYAQIVSDFIGPKVLFNDIERRDVDGSMELWLAK